MNKLMKFIEGMPLVYVLRLMAVLLFVVGIIGTINQMLWPYFMNQEIFGVASLIVAVQTFVMSVFQVLYPSAILLALAEIIKTLKENKNDQD